MKLPPLNWLRTFEAAARALNFTAAARELNMTQSAVSQQVKLLEEALGEPLFNRLPRHIALTKRGRAYLPVVQGALQQLQHGTADIFAPLQSEELTVEVNTTLSVLWLAPRLSAFTQRYPQLRLRIINANWDSEFTSDSAVLSLRHGSGNWPDLNVTTLFPTKVRPFCSPALATEIKSSGNLVEQPLLNVFGNVQNWEAWLSDNNIEQRQHCVIHNTDNSLMAIQMAVHSTGICLSYDALVADYLASGQLVAPFAKYTHGEEGYFLTCSKERELSEGARLLKTWLTEQAIG